MSDPVQDRPVWYPDYQSIPDFIEALNMAGPMRWALLQAYACNEEAAALRLELYEMKKQRDEWMNKCTQLRREACERSPR